MTRHSYVEQDTIDQGMSNLNRTHVMLVGVSSYDDLNDLRGPAVDMEMIAEVFTENPAFALYESSQVMELSNPTSHEFRQAVIDYAYNRSARGDILILYFTGHGCTLPGSAFGFCFSDTKLNYNESGILPLSAVDIYPVIKTLSAVDVHPVFILDACFSSATAPNGDLGAAQSIEKTLRDSYSDTFAFLASSNSQTFSLDAPSGGPFTQAIYTVIQRGLSGPSGKRSPFITLDQLSYPLNEELTLLGAPLSRCYVGRNLPVLPIAKNIGFTPQTESFTPYLKRIVELLWNNGSPYEIPISEFSRQIGQGAYANHSKLSYAPWNLLEDAGSNKIRRLTSRGLRFAEGNLRIPKKILKDHVSGDWIPDSTAEHLNIHEIQ